MNWFEIPPLNSLRAFLALAETGSFSKAGMELNVTHAAVSQQVRSLETRLGTTLVVREGRKIRLTDAGKLLARDLLSGFSIIEDSIRGIVDVDASRPVQITTSPAFAVMWLMPRIVHFQQQNPDITLMLNPTSEVLELKPGGIDLAIRYCSKSDDDEYSDPVLIADMVVVGTPQLIGHRVIGGPDDLLDLPWLQEYGTNEVEDWFLRHGVKPIRLPAVTHMPGNLIMEAVRRGDGVTYTARPFVEREIRAGTLVELFSDQAYGIYHIKTAPGALRRPVRRVVEWLRRSSGTWEGRSVQSARPST